jgi:hypothetical protein
MIHAEGCAACEAERTPFLDILFPRMSEIVCWRQLRNAARERAGIALQSNVDKLELRTTLEWGAIAIAAPHIMEILLYFGTCYVAGLAQWMVLKRITNQVNQHLPYSEQYVATIWTFSRRSVRSPINEIRVWRLHRQFFPESYLPWLHLATWILMIVFLVLSVQFDRAHSIAFP